MIEKFSKDELKQIIEELKNNGYEVKEQTKAIVMNSELKKLFGEDVFVSSQLKQPIYDIADWLLKNYEETGKITRRRKYVPQEMETEYRRIVGGILKVISPYCGMIGFKKRSEI